MSDSGNMLMVDFWRLSDYGAMALAVMVLGDTGEHRINDVNMWKVWKEFCYGKAETLVDVEEAARWWC
jgi:hypothetical protein